MKYTQFDTAETGNSVAREESTWPIVLSVVGLLCGIVSHSLLMIAIGRWVESDRMNEEGWRVPVLTAIVVVVDCMTFVHTVRVVKHFLRRE